jgi:hypothetical protein
VGWTLATEPGRPGAALVAWAFAAQCVIGTVLAVLVAPVVRFLAERAWAVLPLLAFVLGPVAGALAAVALLLLTLVAAGEDPSVSGDGFLALLGFGAVAVGPPWIAYLAVRAAGRSGTGVALASTAWMAVPVGILIVVEELSRR